MKILNQYSKTHLAEPFWHPEGAYVSSTVYKQKTYEVFKKGPTDPEMKKFMEYMVTSAASGVRKWLNDIEIVLEQKMPMEDWQDLMMKKKICKEILKRRVLRKMALASGREAVEKLDKYHHNHPLENLFLDKDD